MTNIKIEEFIVRLDIDTRRRHKHVRAKNKILSFTVQLEILREGKWCPVIRYDTAHGFAHRDFVHADGRVEKTSLFLQDYTEALIFSEEDLKNNWELYKAKFIKEASHDQERNL